MMSSCNGHLNKIERLDFEMALFLRIYQGNMKIVSESKLYIIIRHKNRLVNDHNGIIT